MRVGGVLIGFFAEPRVCMCMWVVRFGLCFVLRGKWVGRRDN